MTAFASEPLPAWAGMACSKSSVRPSCRKKYALSDAPKGSGAELTPVGLALADLISGEPSPPHAARSRSAASRSRAGEVRQSPRTHWASAFEHPPASGRCRALLGPIEMLARARARALAAPMPELPPVTRAPWSCRGRATDEAMSTSLPRSREPRQEPREAAIQVLKDLGLWKFPAAALPPRIGRPGMVVSRLRTIRI